MVVLPDNLKFNYNTQSIFPSLSASYLNPSQVYFLSYVLIITLKGA